MTLVMFGIFSGCIRQKGKGDMPTPSPTESPTKTPMTTLSPNFTLQFNEGMSLKNDKGPAYSQDWSPDETLLAVAGYGTLNLWRIKEYNVTLLAGHTSYIWGIDFSPNGETLASASQDGTVRLWKAPDYSKSDVLTTGLGVLLGVVA